MTWLLLAKALGTGAVWSLPALFVYAIVDDFQRGLANLSTAEGVFFVLILASGSALATHFIWRKR